MEQPSRKSHGSSRRKILDKVKNLVHRKKEASSLRQNDMSSPETGNSGQAVAGALTDQGVSASPHATDTVAQEAGPLLTSEDVWNAQPTEVEAVPPATTASPLLSSKNAPVWNQALQDFQQNHGDEYGWLVAGISRDDNSCIEQWNGLFDPVVPQRLVNRKSDQQPHAFMQRVNAYLPSLSLVKGVMMPLAALDPHKIAPAVCAGVFFTVEFALNQMRPEDRDTTLDILFETAIAINEWITFESLFAQKENPAITKDLQKLHEILPSIHSRGLLLLANIQRSCDKEGFKSRLEKLGRTIEKWKQAAKDLKRDRDRCSSLKKRIEDELAMARNRAEVLLWIRKGDDPELGFKYILQNGPSKKRGLEFEYGQWLLDTIEFKGWANGFRRVRSADEIKRVLWIHGHYGTGKSTLLCRVITLLQEEAKYRSLDNSLRIIPYFCSASSDGSKRPDYQTIIRSLAQKLSWNPDFTVAQVAQMMYDRYGHGTKPLVSTVEWEELLEILVSGIPEESVVVFLIDALDECSSSEEIKKLLRFMDDMIQKSANIQILLSSRQHINVQRHFKDAKKSLVYDLEVRPEKTKPDMVRHIEREIQLRRPTAYDAEESIFSEPIDLAEVAEELLSELEMSSNDWVDDEFKAEYQRLWDANNRRGYGEYQFRLFHLVLCSVVPLTTDHVTSAMRIMVDGSGLYNKELMPRQIKRLYANFLLEDSGGYLQFAHSTAKSFILNMDVKEGGTSVETDSRMFSRERNHREMTNTCLAILKDRDHPAWHQASLAFNQNVLRLRRDPRCQGDILEKFIEMNLASASLFEFQRALLQTRGEDWNHCGIGTTGAEYFTALSDGQDSFPFYVLFFWWNHFNTVYQSKTLFDSEWVAFLDEIILGPQSALYGTILAYCFFRPEFWFQTGPGRYVVILSQPTILHFRYNGELASLRTLCVLACLFSIKDADFSYVELEILAKPTGDGKCSLLERLLQQSRCEGAGRKSALHLACRFHNTVIVKLLLEGTRYLNGERAAWDLLFAQSDEGIPLETSLMFPRIGTPPTEMLLDVEDKVFNSHSKHFGWKQSDDEVALHTSLMNSRNGNPTMEILLDFEDKLIRADPGQFGQEQRQLAFHAESSSFTLFRVTLGRANEDCVLRTLKFAKPEDYHHLKKTTALHISAKREFVSVMADLIEQRGADVNAKNVKNETPLHNAARKGNFKAVKFLLDCPGIRPAEVSKRGETALTIAKAKLAECNLRMETKMETKEENTLNYIQQRWKFFPGGMERLEMERLEEMVSLLEEAELRMPDVNRTVEYQKAS